MWLHDGTFTCHNVKPCAQDCVTGAPRIKCLRVWVLGMTQVCTHISVGSTQELKINHDGGLQPPAACPCSVVVVYVDAFKVSHTVPRLLAHTGAECVQHSCCLMCLV